MDYPWPHDSASKKVFEQALGEAIESERIKPMHVLKVSMQEAVPRCSSWQDVMAVTARRWQ